MATNSTMPTPSSTEGEQFLCDDWFDPLENGVRTRIRGFIEELLGSRDWTPLLDGRVMNVPALAAAVPRELPPAHVTAIGNVAFSGTFGTSPWFACRAPG